MKVVRPTACIAPNSHWRTQDTKPDNVNETSMVVNVVARVKGTLPVKTRTDIRHVPIDVANDRPVELRTSCSTSMIVNCFEFIMNFCFGPAFALRSSTIFVHLLYSLPMAAAPALDLTLILKVFL